MEVGEGKIEPGVSISLSEKQQRARKMRNLAIGGCLLALVAIFYVATIVKIGPNMMKAKQNQEQSN